MRANFLAFNYTIRFKRKYFKQHISFPHNCYRLYLPCIMPIILILMSRVLMLSRFQIIDFALVYDSIHDGVSDIFLPNYCRRSTLCSNMGRSVQEIVETRLEDYSL